MNLGFDTTLIFSTPHQWFAFAHLPDTHLPQSLCRDFSLTLTTLTLYQRSLRWFEACSCRPAPRGLPSSLAQLRAHYKTMRSWRTYLHIFLSTVIFKDTNGIIHSPDRSGSRNNLQFAICNPQRSIIQKHLCTFFTSVVFISRYSNINPKIPYDNAAMSVKRIRAFRFLFQGPA